MYTYAQEILTLLNSNGYKAYIVGGYVRDIYLGRNSCDIDICTSATPKEIKKIFSDVIIYKKYGAVKLNYKNFFFDITTFRHDFYILNKLYIRYVKSIKKDVYRRDFVINTLYMDKNENIIDMLDARKDIESKIIRTVGNPLKRINEDPIRILRAIRYFSSLNFKIDDELLSVIKNNIDLLDKVSFYRKREELDKIFNSKNLSKALNLISDLNIDKKLCIKYKKVTYCSNNLGIWAQMDFSSNYPFSREELKLIEAIRDILNNNIIDNYTVYKYGKNINELCCEIMGITKNNVEKIYNNIKIRNKNDLKLSIQEVSLELKSKLSKKIKIIYDDIEKKVVYNELKNTKADIKKYLKGVDISE